MNKFKQLLLSLSFILCCLGCKKEEAAVPQLQTNNGEVKFVNDMDRDVYLYINDTSGLELQLTLLVKANQTITLPKPKLKGGPGCWYAWYSADYTVTSWNQPRWIYFTYADYAPAQTIHIKQTQPRNDLLICLNGGDTLTKWKAVDAIDGLSGSGIWSSLTTDAQHYKLNIKRMTYWYVAGGIEKKNAGNIITEDKVMVANTSTQDFQVNMIPHYAATTVDVRLVNNLRPQLPYSTTSLDTMYARPANSQWYYVMVKQP